MLYKCCINVVYMLYICCIYVVYYVVCCDVVSIDVASDDIVDY